MSPMQQRMPVRRQDAHRALELLEDYHTQLTDSADVELREAIERVIRIFKSRLFQALLDIQQFYEITLLDDNKTQQQKILESVEIATKWERSMEQKYRYPGEEDEPLPPPPPELLTSITSDKSPEEPSDEWTFEHIQLDRGGSGLGFSIAGGTDNPHLGEDSAICITKVLNGGSAEADQRLRVNDIVVSVNDVSTVSVTHAAAVDALKRAGNNVRLLIKRRRNALQRYIAEIDLLKTENSGLGFSIAGGIGNQHIPGDNGIFITKIIEGLAAEKDSRLSVGDRLLAVNNINLSNVSHEEAVQCLKNSSNRVKLTVDKPYAIESRDVVDLSVDTLPRPLSATLDTRSVQTPAAQTSPLLPPIAPANHVVVGSLPRSTSAQKSILPAHIVSEETNNREVRTIELRKQDRGLGFNIVGGEDAHGIFVSFIQPGGAADVNGDLKRGDRLHYVNDVDLRNATHEMAACTLKNSSDIVTIIAKYQPEEYNKFEEKISDLRDQMMDSYNGLLETNQKKELTVRALFDYDPSKDPALPSIGLAFTFGDILHVTNASDDSWWQARKLICPPDESLGIIPSKKRVERKERLRLKNVKFSGKGSEPRLNVTNKEKKKNFSFSRHFPFMKSKENSEIEEGNTTETLESNPPEDSVLSYESVVQQELQYKRPVILLGPLKEKINDDLITEHPEFEVCVPHTTRKPRPNELDSRDYHFVSSRERMEADIQNHLFIEAGQYNGNLYGTSVASVRQVADNSKHCILDVSGNAIKRLQMAGLHPIAILIKPRSAAVLAEWDKILNLGNTEEQIQIQYNKIIDLETEFAEYYTAMVTGSSIEEVKAKVKRIISEQSGPVMWVRDTDQ